MTGNEFQFNPNYGYNFPPQWTMGFPAGVQQPNNNNANAAYQYVATPTPLDVLNLTGGIAPMDATGGQNGNQSIPNTSTIYGWVQALMQSIMQNTSANSGGNAITSMDDPDVVDGYGDESTDTGNGVTSSDSPAGGGKKVILDGKSYYDAGDNLKLSGNGKPENVLKLKGETPEDWISDVTINRGGDSTVEGTIDATGGAVETIHVGTTTKDSKYHVKLTIETDSGDKIDLKGPKGTWTSSTDGEGNVVWSTKASDGTVLDQVTIKQKGADNSGGTTIDGSGQVVAGDEADTDGEVDPDFADSVLDKNPGQIAKMWASIKDPDEQKYAAEVFARKCLGQTIDPDKGLDDESLKPITQAQIDDVITNIAPKTVKNHPTLAPVLKGLVGGSTDNLGLDEEDPATQQNAAIANEDFSKPVAFAAKSASTFGSMSKGAQDYAAIQFLLNVTNDDVDEGHEDMNDNNYSQKDVDLAIELANKADNKALAEALGRVKSDLLKLDRANGKLTGEDNLTEREDLSKVADKIKEKGMNITIEEIGKQLQLSKDKDVNSIT